MLEQEKTNYKRIEKAIKYIKQNFKKQPSLNEIAKFVNLSPYHFQRIFTDFAGVSPKKFIQYLSIEYTKKLLKKEQLTLFNAAYEVGLSGTGRLHDLFISIEGMTPGEYKSGGENLCINYCFVSSHFGKLIIASTEKGVCYLHFENSKSQALKNLKKHYPNAKYCALSDKFQKDALTVFKQSGDEFNQIKLHLKGTPFQIKVWESLLKIPMGTLSTYSSIAQDIESAKAYRAVGTAIGNNPVAFLIPCHRVIRANGDTGDYMWGSIRKSAIIAWEASVIVD